ncbi:MAG: putative glycolipid-binding domain-containing protein, partial [Actinomycetes bacterium]
CHDLSLDISPFTQTIPIRRLPLHVGHTADITTVTVDVETLEVRADHQRYTRAGERAWVFTHLETGEETAFEVDEHGLPLDQPGRFRRSL